jgi:hypothetical protein
VAGESGRVGLVGQPVRQAGHEPGGADPFGENVGVEEVLLHELAEGDGELVLPLNDQRCVRYRQAQGTAEKGRHGEPVRHAADHGRLGAGLHVAENGSVNASRGHGHEQDRDRREQSGGPPPRGSQATRSQCRRLALNRRNR